jgi:transcriptional regulator with XRE-family HTH domain
MHYSTHLLRHLRFAIGQHICYQRTRQKMTLRYLARKSGVPEHKLDQYEIGKNEIGLDDLLKIACVLKVRLTSLF